MNRPVTCWYRWDEQKQQWAYNHLEFGHNNYPQPETKEQKEAWESLKFKPKYQYLNHENEVCDKRF